MPKSEYKKPPVETLQEALRQTNGNLTNTAKLLGVDRTTLWQWAKKDPDFAQAIDESRKKLLDSCITTAQILAQGVPILDDNGKFIGWQERPDPQMLRYFIATLGREEGFGEEVTLRHTTDEGVDVSRWIEREIEMKSKQTQEE